MFNSQFLEKFTRLCLEKASFTPLSEIDEILEVRLNAAKMWRKTCETPFLTTD
jgi:hypothetical protein